MKQKRATNPTNDSPPPWPPIPSIQPQPNHDHWRTTTITITHTFHTHGHTEYWSWSCTTTIDQPYYWSLIMYLSLYHFQAKSSSWFVIWWSNLWYYKQTHNYLSCGETFIVGLLPLYFYYYSARHFDWVLCIFVWICL